MYRTSTEIDALIAESALRRAALRHECEQLAASVERAMAGVEELAKFWPTMPNLDGEDRFAEWPVSGDEAK